MKKFLAYIIILFVWQAHLHAHPVHVSVINISVDGLILSLSMNTHAADWETAYFHYYGKQVDLKNASPDVKEWFEEYLRKSFIIKTKQNSEALEILIDNIRFEDHNMKLEMHVNLKEEAKSLYIYNSILTDIFADQTNLLIYPSENGEKGIKFDYQKKEEELRLR